MKLAWATPSWLSLVALTVGCGSIACPDPLVPVGYACVTRDAGATAGDVDGEDDAPEGWFDAGVRAGPVDAPGRAEPVPPPAHDAGGSSRSEDAGPRDAAVQPVTPPAARDDDAGVAPAGGSAQTSSPGKSPGETGPAGGAKEPPPAACGDGGDQCAVGKNGYTEAECTPACRLRQWTSCGRSTECAPGWHCVSFTCLPDVCEGTHASCPGRIEVSPNQWCPSLPDYQSFEAWDQCLFACNEGKCPPGFVCWGNDPWCRLDAR